MFSGFLVAFFLRDFGVTGVFVMITATVNARTVFGPNSKGKALDNITAIYQKFRWFLAKFCAFLSKNKKQY